MQIALMLRSGTSILTDYSRTQYKKCVDRVASSDNINYMNTAARN